MQRPSVERAPVELHRADGVAYDRALRWQRERHQSVREGGPEAVAFVQHLPVYTLGVRTRREHLLVDPQTLAARGAVVREVDRGGDVTFHGPGQLVAYPILNLRARGLHAADYVRRLEQCVIETLAAFGVHGERVARRPGVWVASAASTEDDRRPLAKVAAVGVRIERGASRHGLALNVRTDLSWFDAIVPCGIADASVTSITELLGRAPTIDAVAGALGAAFERVFGSRLEAVARTPLAPPDAHAEAAS
ncbi:MAG: lipoyl(octanoyl) transferase LipB [Chloroflexi bacterium]|nr:lipoyl(octanoyl) transferase LipB [Chloroflexota bacterium]